MLRGLTGNLLVKPEIPTTNAKTKMVPGGSPGDFRRKTEDVVAFIVDHHVTLFCVGSGHTPEYAITLQRGQLEVFVGAVQQRDSGKHLLDPAFH